MSVSRRRFLRSGAVAAFTAGIVLGTPEFTFAQLAPGSGQKPAKAPPLKAFDGNLESFTRETFEPYVGTTFVGKGHGRGVDLTLVSVRAYEPKDSSITKRSIQTESFSLHFESSRPLYQVTSIHPLSHDAIGEFSPFLTHSKGEDGKCYYEAVFNRLKV